MSNPVSPSQNQVLIIRPFRPWWELDFVELWQFRETLFFLVWRNIKVRYKQTVLGVLWAVLQPLIGAGIFTIVFSLMAHVPSDGVNYSLFSYSGLVMWTYFSGAVTLASNCLTNDSNLIRKVYFPRLILPVTACVTGWVDFAMGSVLLVAWMFMFGAWPGQLVLLVPFFLLLATLTAFSISLWLSALDAKYHDIRYTVPFLTQICMFLSPVICSVTLVRKTLHVPFWAYGVNPMASAITGFRWCMGLGPRPDGYMLISSCLVVLILSLSGLWYFKRTERFFADVM